MSTEEAVEAALAEAQAESAEPFEPLSHLMDLKGKKYLPVAARVKWFRSIYPHGTIRTTEVAIDLTYTERANGKPGYARFHAEVYDENERLLGTGTKTETAQGFPDYVEKAEAGSVGRALAMAGFGTPLDGDIDEGRVVDTPRTYRNSPPVAQAARPTPRPAQAAPPADPADERRRQQFALLQKMAVEKGFQDLGAVCAELNLTLEALRNDSELLKKMHSWLSARVPRGGAA
jgi:hypothetical protein